MNHQAILSIIAAMTIAAEGQPTPERVQLRFADKPGKHRTPQAKKQARPGRNRPAKGYDPVTKTWNQ